jgi:hypothetical protein
VQVERGFYLLTSGMLLDVQDASSPGSHYGCGHKPKCCSIGKIHNRRGRIERSGSAQLFPFFPTKICNGVGCAAPRPNQRLACFATQAFFFIFVADVRFD